MTQAASAVEIANVILEQSRLGQLDYYDLSAFASILRTAKNYQVAAHIYYEWLGNAQSPFVANVYCDLGDVLVELNDDEGAMRAFSNALHAFPGYLRARVGISTCQ